MKDLLQLFLVFTKIGAFLFGGGYAMLPLLTRELVDKRSWASEDELLDYFAIAQCTPGVIAINTATFVGNKRHGVIGGIIATLGVIFVPFWLIIGIAALLSNFADIPAVQHAFAGVRCAVAALIAASVIRLFKNNVLPKKTAPKTSAPETNADSAVNTESAVNAEAAVNADSAVNAETAMNANAAPNHAAPDSTASEKRNPKRLLSVWLPILLCALAFVAVGFLQISPVVVVLIAGLCGFLMGKGGWNR